MLRAVRRALSAPQRGRKARNGGPPIVGAAQSRPIAEPNRLLAGWVSHANHCLVSAAQAWARWSATRHKASFQHAPRWSRAEHKEDTTAAVQRTSVLERRIRVFGVEGGPGHGSPKAACLSAPCDGRSAVTASWPAAAPWHATEVKDRLGRRGAGPLPTPSLETLGSSLERTTGIEPAPPAWKAGALPLSYVRAASL